MKTRGAGSAAAGGEKVKATAARITRTKPQKKTSAQRGTTKDRASEEPERGSDKASGTDLEEKKRKNNRMVIKRIPDGHFAIACPAYNCYVCHCFNAETIERLKNKAKDGQIVPTLETIPWANEEEKKTVDLWWDTVPSLFRKISAYTKMKKHIKEDHPTEFHSDMKNWPAIFCTPTLEQQRRTKEQQRRRRNKNNSSAIDL